MNPEDRSTLEYLPVRKKRSRAGQDPQKREQILHGSRDVFFRTGFHAATVDDIARASEVSKGTIYVYFRDKDELFTAFANDYASEMSSSLIKHVYEPASREGLVSLSVSLLKMNTSVEFINVQRTIISVVDRLPAVASNFYKRVFKVQEGIVDQYLADLVANRRLDIVDMALARLQLLGLLFSDIYRERLFGFKSKNLSDKALGSVATSAVDQFWMIYSF